MKNLLHSLKFGRRGVVALIIIVALALGLWADLQAHGLVWQTLWNVTGEEDPLPQVRGLVEYLGNWTRVQPQTAPLTSVRYSDAPPYGINTFLQLEVEPIKRERSLQMIADAGFKMIRQQFPWEDIEIHGRGDFTDHRNDTNGDGKVDERDTVDAWAKYDNIVGLAEKYGVQIQARLDNPPKWSNSIAGGFGPPDDVQDYVNYAVTVAQRYKGRIRYYQIWNEPNANGEWGNLPANPEAYTDLLCRTYTALKAVDPSLVVISGPLSPTVSLADNNLNDFIFLERMYAAGAGACFDIMSAQGYGFFSSPTDRRMRPFTLTFARNLYIRDIMIAHGDAEKPIWISEAAWNAQPEDPSVVTSQYGNFGIVSLEQAARYMPLGYQRAQEEWPWVGNISYWFFKRPADYEKNQAFYYFRMVEPDFTPLPVYVTLRDYISNHAPTLYTGVHQAEHWAVQRADNWQLVADADAQFGEAVNTTTTTFTTHGTAVYLRWRADSSVKVSLDGGEPKLIYVFPERERQWNESLLVSSLTPETHTFTVTGFVIGRPINLDTISVYDRSAVNLFPYGALAIGAVLAVLFAILAARRRWVR